MLASGTVSERAASYADIHTLQKNESPRAGAHQTSSLRSAEAAVIRHAESPSEISSASLSPSLLDSGSPRPSPKGLQKYARNNGQGAIIVTKSHDTSGTPEDRTFSVGKSKVNRQLFKTQSVTDTCIVAYTCV